MVVPDKRQNASSRHIRHIKGPRPRQAFMHSHRFGPRTCCVRPGSVWGTNRWCGILQYVFPFMDVDVFETRLLTYDFQVLYCGTDG